MTDKEKPEVPQASIDYLQTVLGGFVVPDEYLEHVGNEEWIYDNLIIKGQILTLCSESNGGKTAIMFFYIAIQLVKKDYTVIYIDLDSPASDHKHMGEFAKKSGIMWLNPNTIQGVNVESVLEKLEGLAGSNKRLDSVVFIFDTLKKFNDMMSKKSTKEFYELCRNLTGKGATIILLSHTNKKTEGGNLVFEGVGDVKNDGDALIFLEKKIEDNIQYITTIVDIDRGAKVRGVYERLSFEYNRRTRKIRQLMNVVDIKVPKENREDPPDDDVLEAVYKCIEDSYEALNLQQLSSTVKDYFFPSLALNKIKFIINSRIGIFSKVPIGKAYYKVGSHNTRSYYLYETDEGENESENKEV